LRKVKSDEEPEMAEMRIMMIKKKGLCGEREDEEEEGGRRRETN
jgi:hypothetical protein